MLRLQCKYCGAPIEVNRAGETVCPYCGTVFWVDRSVCPTTEIAQEPAEVFSVQEDERVDSDDWQCSFCDARNRKESNYCVACGCERMEWPAATMDDYWKCSFCGSKNSRESVYCIVCGRTEEEATKVGALAHAVAENRWCCPNCGYPNGTEDLFCCNCGEMRMKNY